MKPKQCSLCGVSFIPKKAFHKLCHDCVDEKYDNHKHFERHYEGEWDDDAPGGYELGVDYFK